MVYKVKKVRKTVFCPEESYTALALVLNLSKI